MVLQNGGGPSQAIRITKMNALGEKNHRVVPVAVHHPLDEGPQLRPSIPKLPATAEHDRLVTDGPLQRPWTVMIGRSCVSNRDPQLVLESLELGNPDQMVTEIAMVRIGEQSAALRPMQDRYPCQPLKEESSEVSSSGNSHLRTLPVNSPTEGRPRTAGVPN
jgi:hypothetical protein